ncbi:hypothetical protein GCK72_005256 [Caenorhabditis remanei]|uniref:SH2 domain-containing protein n=1 Tax=Caenorhabditis remanei TaxID=31234 RepID=A0A6A5HEQ1_CAERE|nr:hypothetical protein GCK72_005256 [Caenorhabditis remanei]KAF1765304.1 hypothetical protein GCK72_005256 [Caenorhabditis remanei]
MTDGSCQTPYNSTYETLIPKNQKQDAELVCCKHGCQCSYGKKTTVENQYVNLASPKEQQVAEKLRAELEKLQVKSVKVEKNQKKKSSSKEKRKKKTVEDNHAYEMMGPTTEGSTNSSAPVTTESLESHVRADNTAFAVYIGASSSSDAESRVTRRGEFAIYHQYETGGCIDHLTPGLPLMLVYYTTTKKHRHYPIRTSGSDGELHYSVDCGYPMVRKHFSLTQLVQYYKTFGSIQTNTDETCSEAFSWWLE